jgi:hypothetical protein
LKRIYIVAVASALGLASLAGIQAAVGASAPEVVAGPPAATDGSAPSMPRDLGVGERLLLVVEGVYPTQEAAELANEAFSFGEVQGFYAVQVGNFAGLKEPFPGKGGWALVSAFRTQEGAQEFAELAKLAGAKVVITQRVTSLGGSYAGLGQESAPDGSGPLQEPVPASEPVEP